MTRRAGRAGALGGVTVTTTWAEAMAGVTNRPAARAARARWSRMDEGRNITRLDSSPGAKFVSAIRYNGGMYRETDADDPGPLLIVALGNRVMALDRRTGELRWETDVSTLGHAIELAIVDDRVFAVTSAGHVYLLDYLDGNVITRVQLPGSYRGRATLVVDRGHLFIASGGEITCVDRGAQVVWFNGLEGKGVGDAALGFPGKVRQVDSRG